MKMINWMNEKWNLVNKNDFNYECTYFWAVVSQPIKLLLAYMLDSIGRIISTVLAPILEYVIVRSMLLTMVFLVFMLHALCFAPEWACSFLESISNHPQKIIGPSASDLVGGSVILFFLDILIIYLIASTDTKIGRFVLGQFVQFKANLTTGLHKTSVMILNTFCRKLDK